MPKSRAEYADEVHASYRRPKQLRKVVVSGLDNTWTSDETGPIADPTKANKGYKYIIVVEDALSRFAWATPLKEISALTTWKAFNDIVQSSGRKPDNLWVDRGTSYYGAAFAGPAAKAGIRLYSVYGDHKAAMAERLIQTLAARVWRRMTTLNTKNWVDVLPDVVHEYNTAPHASLGGKTPTEASQPAEARRQHAQQYGSYLARSVEAPTLELGMWVRVSRQKDGFEKGRTENWTTELFKIAGVNTQHAPVVYTLQDAEGNVLQGSFYTSQLKRSAFGPTEQQELLYPKKKPAEVGPDEVARVVSYRVDPAVKGKLAKYLLTVELGDGSREEIPLSLYVGRVNAKTGAFKASATGDQILEPINTWLKGALPAVWESI